MAFDFFPKSPPGLDREENAGPGVISGGGQFFPQSPDTTPTGSGPTGGAYTPAPAPSHSIGPINFDDLGKNIGGAFSDFGSAIQNVGSAAENYENTRETTNFDPGAYLGSLGGLGKSLLNVVGKTPVVGGILNGIGTAVTAPLGFPALTSGSTAARQAYDEQQNNDNTPIWGGLTAPIRGLSAAEQARGEELGSIASDGSQSVGDRAKAALGAGLYGLLPFVMPVPGAEALGAIRGARAAEARTIGFGDLRAPDVVPGSIGDAGRAAIEESDPRLSSIGRAPGTTSLADNTLRDRMGFIPDEAPPPTPENPYPSAGEPVRAPYDAPQLPANTQTTGLEPIEARAPAEPPAEAPSAGSSTAGPVPKEDSGASTAAPQPLTPGKPYSFADLEARGGVKPGEALFAPGEKPMLTAEDFNIEGGLTARIGGRGSLGVPEEGAGPMGAQGAATRALAETTRAAEGRPITMQDLAPKPTTDVYNALADSLKAKGRPDLVVSRDAPEAPSAYVARNPTLLARHNAGQEFKAAVRSAVETGDWTAADAAAQKVAKVGGDVKRYIAQLRKEGISAPTAGELRAVERKGRPGGTVPPAAQDVPAVRGGFRDRVADFNKDDIGGGRLPFDKNARYGTPKAVEAERLRLAAIGDPRISALAEDPRLAALRPQPNPGRYVPTGGQRPTGARTPAGAPPRISEATPGSVPGRAAPIDKLTLAENLATLPKSTTTLLSPEHAVGRHISSLVVSDPIAAARGVAGGLKTVGQFIKNPAEARITMARLNDSMRRELDARGLGVTEINAPHGGPRSGSDFMPSTLPNKVPGLGRIFEGTQAAFGQTQNIARFNAAKHEVAILEWMKRRPLTQAEKDGVVDRINHFTGRGFRTETPEAQSARAKAAAGGELDLPEKNAIASSNEKYKTAQLIGRIANIPMFSPQLRTSYARMVGDLATAVRHPAAPESLATFHLAAGTLGLIGLYAAGAKAAGLNLDIDPTSSNFLKIDLGTKDQAKGVLGLIASQLGAGMTAEDNGHVYLDTTHGMASYIKTIAQTVADLQTGKKNLDGSPAFGNPTGNLLKNMLSPGLFDLNELRLGKQIKPAGAVLPITVTGPIEASGGKVGPTVQVAGGHLFKGEAPADIQLGPKPAPTTRPSAPAKSAPKKR